MTTLHCFGAGQEVGRSSFLLETDKRILLDHGIKVFDLDGKPKFPIESPAVDVALITHAHLDHSGFLPNLYVGSKTKWFATPPTRDIAKILWMDSLKISGDQLPYNTMHCYQALRHLVPLSYGVSIEIGSSSFRFLDAGHISGSSMIELEYNNRKIVYTGDFKMEETKMHKGAKPVEDVDVVIIDSTYGLREHPERQLLERKLADEIDEIIAEGGAVLLPAFSVGRTQELIGIVRAHNKTVPVFVDGMGKIVTATYLKHQKYIKDVNRFRKDVNTVHMVETPRERRYATQIPSVIISSAGMMQGGQALNYLLNINARSKIIFTGFNVDGTNGWKLLNKNYVTINGRDLEVSLPVEYLDFSAHASRSDILNFIKWANPEKIVVVHTDTGKKFEQELREDFGFDAVAPKVGEKIDI